MKFITIICLVLLFSITCSDKDCHETINFINNSGKFVYVQKSNGYPDTTYLRYEFPNPALNPQLYKVKAGEKSSSALFYRNGCYEAHFKTLKSDTLMIYVFDAQILETTPWDTITAKYLVLKRYNLSLEDLKQMNWTIIYP